MTTYYIPYGTTRSRVMTTYYIPYGTTRSRVMTIYYAEPQEVE